LLLNVLLRRPAADRISCPPGAQQQTVIFVIIIHSRLTLLTDVLRPISLTRPTTF